MYGTLKVICGPMSCGKTEELIRQLNRAKIAKQRVILFKSSIDTRNAKDAVSSRNGSSFEAETIENPGEILTYLDKIDAANTGQIVKVIGIDEGHFFKYNGEDGISRVIKILLRRGKNVIIAGLDQDFLGEPFETIAKLMAVADKVLKLSAICLKCGGDAVMSQKISDGQPAPRNTDRIKAGGDQDYFAVCRNCHIILS